MLFVGLGLCFFNLVGLIDIRHDRRINTDNGGRNLGHNARCCLEFLDRIIRRDQEWIGLDPHSQPIAGLDLCDMFPLLVDQEIHNTDRCLDQHLAGPTAHALFFQLAQNVQSQIVVGPDQPRAVAMVTGLCRGFDHAGAQTLTAHLHQPKARNAANLDTRAIRLEPLFETFLNRRVVLALIHVDEVDHDQACKVAKAQLTRNFLGRFQVGLERGFLDGPLFGRPARVHIDGHKRLCHADHNIAARLQLNGRIEHRAQVAFYLIAREQWQGVGIKLHVLGVARHDHFHEVLGHAIALLTLDKHFVDFLGIQVTDRPFDQVAFFVNFGRRRGFQRQIADLFPQTLQIFIVALHFGLGALRSGRANDQPRAVRHLDRVGDFFQLLAIRGIRDLAADPSAACSVGHQDAIAACQ